MIISEWWHDVALDEQSLIYMINCLFGTLQMFPSFFVFLSKALMSHLTCAFGILAPSCPG